MYNFTDPSSQVYSNLRYIGQEIHACCYSQHAVESLKARLDSIGLSQQELKVVRAEDIETPMQFHKLKEIPVLVVVVDENVVGVKEAYERVKSDIVDVRLRLAKTTVVVYPHSDSIHTAYSEFNKSTPFSELTTLCADRYEIRTAFELPLWENIILKDRQKDNVCFLDIDGSLLFDKSYLTSRWQGTHSREFLNNPIESVKAFDSYTLAFLRKVSAASGLSFVLSSQWRIGMTDQNVRDLGRYLGIPIIGKVVNGGNRKAEITQYIEEHKPSGILSWFDDEDLSELQGIHGFKISSKDGMSFAQMGDFAKLYGCDIYDFTNSKFEFHKPVQE